ncbi:crotonase/enoyl-CoA hydratase family protein [Emcibacter sp. SYSU 3D8]|uniref:crotonase/enoyl-CoA hydratase family protein n=1 Tax=Emcibacter sp. SYSU 3D8 TaxID=3133969 RepID=UPI0031FE61F3
MVKKQSESGKPAESGHGDDNNALGRIVTAAHGDVLLVGIDRPRKLNGFTNKMLDELSRAYADYEAGPWRCAVLHSTGKHFTAGLDLPNIDRGRPLFDRSLLDPVGLYPPLRTKPVIAAVRGITFTIGFELALAADFIICGSDARIAQLEVKRGLMPTCGGTPRMIERAGWGNAMRYLLTGDEMNAATALRLGFVQEVVDPEAVLHRALVLARRIAEQAPLAVQAVIANGRKAHVEGFDAATAELGTASGRLRDSDDVKEGVASFVERRKARFTGR